MRSRIRLSARSLRSCRSPCRPEAGRPSLADALEQADADSNHVTWIVLLAASVSLAAASDLRLVDAVKSRNAEAVQALLKQRVDVNAPQGDGATALHWAVHFDDLPIAELLIRAGARVECRQRYRRHAALPRLHEPQRGDGREAPGGGRESERGAPERRDGADDVFAHRRDSRREGAAGPWRQRQREGAVARPDGADVGGGTEDIRRSSRALVERGADVRARSRVYTQTVTSEVTQRAGREELNYTVPRGGSTPLLFAARVGRRRVRADPARRRAPTSTTRCRTAPARWWRPPTAASRRSASCCSKRVRTRTPPRSATPRSMRRC